MKTILKLFARLMCISAIFIIAALCGYAYITPASLVSLDANVSIGYSLNIFDRVLDLSSSNETGEDIIYYSHLNNKEITEAIQETIDNLISSGYISQDNNLEVTITVANSDKNKADRLMKKLNESMQNYIVGKTEIENVYVNIETEIKN